MTTSVFFHLDAIFDCTLCMCVSRVPVDLSLSVSFSSSDVSWDNMTRYRFRDKVCRAVMNPARHVLIDVFTPTTSLHIT